MDHPGKRLNGSRQYRVWRMSALDRRPRLGWRRPSLWAALLLAGCTAPAPMAQTPSIALECRLEPRPPLVAGGPVALRFELANRSEAPIWVLKWNSPLEGWMGTLVSVSRDGEELDY